MYKKIIAIISHIFLLSSSCWAQLIIHSDSQKMFKEDEKVNVSTSFLPFAYASNSVLANGKFVKIKIVDSGVYKFTYEDLATMGVNPVNVRIFGYGGAVLNQNLQLNKVDDLPETAIWMEKGTDGVFSEGDYILFYAQGINRWIYDSAKGMFTHQSNSYSNTGYYFVTSDAGEGKHIKDKTVILPESTSIQQVEEFVNYKVYEKDLISILNSGKEFYGEKFDEVTSYDIPFTFSNPVQTNSTKVRLDVAASSYTSSMFTLTLNGLQAKTVNFSSNYGGPYEKAKAASAIFSLTPQGENFGFNLSYNKPNSYSKGYLNYLEINTRCQLKMVGVLMPFQNVDYLGTKSFLEYKLSDASANLQIWDITDPVNIERMVTKISDGKLTFIASGNEETHYIAIDPTASTSFAKPEIIGIVPNQNLHAITQADMVIITHPDFITQSEILAQAHRQKDNMTVTVVTTDQVYNEFSSGTPDATAYRRIMKMLYDRAITTNTPNDKPKYLLLFGRGSFDNRKLLTDSGDNLVLTYQADNSLDLTLSYVTDDYFALLDDNEGIQIPTSQVDLGVGRFPVTTAQQATDMVNKTISYMSNSIQGNWKNKICFLADDGDNALHAKQADSLAAVVRGEMPAFRITKIYIDAYQQTISAGVESFPDAKTKLLNLLKSGLIMLNYTGYGSAEYLANEKIITDEDILGLTNVNLPLWMGATSEFSRYDVKNVSAGEKVLLNSLGGGIGVFSSARPCYASQNFSLNRALCSNLFKKVNGKQLRIGDAIRLAKNQLGAEINKFTFNYLGDPAIKLNIPGPYNIQTTGINTNMSFGTDTLKALSDNTFHGIISDDSDSQVSSFNGKLHFELFDKNQRFTTLDNDKDGAFTFLDRPEAILTGDVQVVDGVFNIPFIMPTNIDSDFGSGRIIYYAQDDSSNKDAQGYFENFIIGGSDIGNGICLPTISNGLSVTNQPNPVKNQTRFVVNYGNPESIVNAIIDIFDISGRKIKSISQSSINNIVWDLSDKSSNKIKTGIYVYQVTLKTNINDIKSAYCKLIILAD